MTLTLHYKILIGFKTLTQDFKLIYFVSKQALVVFVSTFRTASVRVALLLNFLSAVPTFEFSLSCFVPQMDSKTGHEPVIQNNSVNTLKCVAVEDPV